LYYSFEKKKEKGKKGKKYGNMYRLSRQLRGVSRQSEKAKKNRDSAQHHIQLPTKTGKEKKRLKFFIPCRIQEGKKENKRKNRIKNELIAFTTTKGWALYKKKKKKGIGGKSDICP